MTFPKINWPAEWVAVKKHWPVLVAVFVVYWFMIHRTEPAQIPHREQHTIDSLVITRPLDSALVDSLKHTVAVKAQAARASATLAKQDSARADSAAATADSLAAIARRAGDSLSLWHTAFAAESTTVRRQKQQLFDNSRTIEDLEADTTAQARIIRLRDNRLEVIQNLNAKLQKDFAHANDCNILPFVRCPTRKETVVLTVLTYFGTKLVLKR